MGRYICVILLFIFIPFDLIPTLLWFGFYSPKFQFDSEIFLDNLLLKNGYNFTRNPLDFLLLAILRTLFALFILLIMLKRYNYSTKSLSLIIFGFFIINWAYTLCKLLAFSEDANYLANIGVWLSLFWNISSSLIISFISHFALFSSKFNYRRLISHESLLETLSSNSDNDKRIGTFQHALRLLNYCKIQWKWYMAGFFFLFLYSAAGVFIPYYTGQVVSNIVQSKGQSALLQSIFYIFLLTFFSSIASGLRGGCFDYAIALVHRQIRLDLFNSLVSQEIGFFDVTKTGEIVSRLTADCQTMSNTVALNVNILMRNGIMMIGGIIFMLYLSWRLTLVTFIAVPLVGFVAKLFGSYYDKISEKTQATIANANHIAEEVISTIRTVRSFACEMKEISRFENGLNETLNINKKKSIAYVAYTWTSEICDNAILVGVLFYGGHLALSGKMSTDSLISFLFYQLQLGTNLYSLSWVFSGLMESVGASRKVFEYMYRKPQILASGKCKSNINGDLKFCNVKFSYPSRQNNIVLKGISFSISSGEIVALVGPSGGGKSSIVSLIERFYDCDEGAVLVDGININEYDHVYYHQKVSLVAQEPVLFEGTVRHNILYGCDSATEDDMLRAAELANVHNFVMEMEKGYDTNCGEKGVQMSGGQKQRIAIARALVRNPAILILDEATSALDAESEHLIQESIAKCAKERSVIIIAHRLSTVERSDRIIVINKGELVQQGRHDELVNQEGIYKMLIQRQMIGQNASDTF